MHNIVHGITIVSCWMLAVLFAFCIIGTWLLHSNVVPFAWTMLILSPLTILGITAGGLQHRGP